MSGDAAPTPAGITRLAMPKWGLSMRQGKVTDWLVEVGDTVDPGEELFEVETEKIDGAVESPAGGVLRRRVAEVGAVVPVGGLVGVLADPGVADAEVDAFVAEFQASFVPEDAEGEAEAPTRAVEVGGRRLRYLELGPETPRGDPVVLLHGFGGDLNNWLFTSGKLAERRRVVAPDLPGHGESAKDVGAGDLAAFVGVLEGFLDAVGTGRAHLVGHSLGGAVALGYALDHPDRVASLTLVAAVGLGPEINGAYLDGFVAAERRRELKGVLELLFADPGLVNRQLVDDVLRYKRLDGVDQALGTVAAAMFPAGRQAAMLTDRLDRLSVPLLVIWGEQDRVLPAAHAGALAGHGRVQVLAGVGHSPHMEAANEVNRLVGGFLDEQEVEAR
ncbi:MAG TPA: acetoin dehydrogenase dihydrolipoyllysine-residue acetyltransferase subunit [Actinomycetes bacterium]|nr:acetoin dehydrogenase dihydrolipoyllysine-residue acetyltransferase subunit [Actinomycetes bacterium]